MEKLNRIKGYRVMIGITQEEMATEIGISLKGYTDKENGKSALKTDELKKIQVVFKNHGLETTIDELI